MDEEIAAGVAVVLIAAGVVVAVRRVAEALILACSVLGVWS